MYRTTHPPPKGRKQKHQWAGSHGPLAATPQFASLPPISGGRQSLVGRDMAHASARSMSRSSRRESGVMSASRRTLSPLQSTSPDTVLKMNVKAMELLGKENMDASEKKMQAALQLAETGVQNFRQNLSLNDNEDSRKMLESWLLALAVTLSNYGSLRRRMNQPQEALMYMERAQDAEKEVFGEPSCATLLNMSAVMLALGMFDEALNVARDCAAASEGRDPMLHAVALHNYGVALRSHPTSGANESAAPILMKALREAESKLGVHHPTTVIIRQRCGMAATGSRSGRTDGSRGRSTKKKGGSTTSLNKSTNSSRASPSKSVKRSTPSVCNERASTGRKRKSVSRGSPSSRPTEGSPDIRDRVKRAIKRLDYGEVDTMYTESCTLSANDNELGQTECSKQPSECSGSPAPLSVLPTSRETSLLNEVVAAPRQDSPSVTRSGPCSPTIVKLPAVDLSRGWSPPRSKCMTATIVCRNPVAGGANPTGTPPDACSSDVPEIRETCPPRGAPCHVVEGLDSTQVKEEPTDKNNEPRPSRTTGHLAGSRSHGSTQQEANARGSRSINSKKSLNSAFLSGYIDLTCDLSKDGPSFIHYADIEAFALPAVKQMSHLTTPRDLVHSNAADERARCREEKRRKRCLLGLDSSDDVDLYLGEEEEEDEDEDEEEGKKCEGSPERSPEMHGGRDMLEKAKEGDAAKGKKMIVTKIIGVSPAVRRLQRIKKEQEEEEKMRTRLRKEAEELAQKQYFERTLQAIIARTRERAATTIQNAWYEWWVSVGRRRRELLNKRAADKARRETQRLALLDSEGYATQERRAKETVCSTKNNTKSVLKCCKKWLEITKCLRYAVRNGIRTEERDNKFFHLKVVKLQAIWRGVSERRRKNHLAESRKQQTLSSLHQEDPHYAALVIQKFVRCVFARRMKKRLKDEHYTPSVIKIQRWVRGTLDRLHRLGIDRVTIFMKDHCAKLIQRTWRSYLARVAFAVSKLRLKLNESRRQEQRAAAVIQRIGRGFLCRRTVAARSHFMKTIYTTMNPTNPSAVEGPQDKTPQLPPPPSYVPSDAEEVRKIAEEEREKYHIGIFVEGVARRERQKLIDSMRLRPFQVLRRRAEEDHLTGLELNVFRRERAAIKIQREFRAWRRIRHDASRDRTLLLMGRGKYVQSFYETKLLNVLHKDEYESGAKIYGDQAVRIRAVVSQVQQDMDELKPLVRTHVQPHEVRTRQERWKVEEELIRDEELTAKNEFEDLLKFRREKLMNCFRKEVMGDQEHPPLLM